MLDKLLILCNIIGITIKVTAENFNALSHACKNTCFGISQVQVTMVFFSDDSVTFIDKTYPSDPLKGENIWRETLRTMGPMSLILKIASEFYHFDNVEVGTSYYAHVFHFMDYWNGLFFRT